MDTKTFDLRKTIILDGAMGTMLQKYLKNEEWLPPEVYNITKGELIESIHKEYVEAGSEIIYTNTFGANRKKLPIGVSLDFVVREGVRIAKRAADGKALVALDIGPIGELLEPIGELSFDDAVDIYKEIITCGVKEEADIIAFETFTDLLELKAAIVAAKEITDLPIFATMTFEKNLRTYVGVTIEAMAITLEAIGVAAMGINCSLSPIDLYPHVEALCAVTSLPIIIKANNGLPDSEGIYPDSKEAFLEHYTAFNKLGVNMFGGCCGTTPAHIGKLRPLKKCSAKVRSTHEYVRVCSDSIVVDCRGVRVIGERLNPTGKKILKKALADEDYDYIFRQASEQIEDGADILDVNCGIAEVDEKTLLPKLIQKLQKVIRVPLQIDSVAVEAIEKACRYYNGKPIINSVNGSETSIRNIFPIAKKYGAAVVALAMKDTLPKNKEERVAEITQIIEEGKKYGIASYDIIADCLTLTAAGEQLQAQETLAALEEVGKMGICTTLGVSNISFGLPRREQFTAAFLSEALSRGLNFPIINPNSYAVMNSIRCHKVLTGEDGNSLDYIEFCKNSEERGTTVTHVSTVKEKVASEKYEAIENCIKKGLKNDALNRLEGLLMTTAPMDILSEGLLPILDELGERYATGKIFLPQLILASDTAKCLFDKMSEKMDNGEERKHEKKILLASVKGDMHDIGKNLVKVILHNYGYEVIDLGKSVDAAKIVATVIAEDIKLVGLSALMTTTAGYMQTIVEKLKKETVGVAVMIGGAVITKEFADKIGADYYAKTAIEGVAIARKVFA